MDREEFYTHTIDGEVHTYTRALWDEVTDCYVQHLIEPEEYAQAKKDGKDVREVTL